VVHKDDGQEEEWWLTGMFEPTTRKAGRMQVAIQYQFHVDRGGFHEEASAGRNRSIDLVVETLFVVSIF
jgi:hypothetical protein